MTLAPCCPLGFINWEKCTKSLKLFDSMWFIDLWMCSAWQPSDEKLPCFWYGRKKYIYIGVTASTEQDWVSSGVNPCAAVFTEHLWERGSNTWILGVRLMSDAYRPRWVPLLPAACLWSNSALSAPNVRATLLLGLIAALEETCSCLCKLPKL